jgi:toxin ParE1/3/4
MTSSRRCRLFKHERAKQDLVDIYSYFFERSEQTAQNFLAETRQAFDLILRMPGIGRRWSSPIPELATLGVTSVSRRFRDYLIFYRPTSEGIEIVTVLHGARDLAKILESLDS